MDRIIGASTRYCYSIQSINHSPRPTHSTMTITWQQTAAQARADRDALIPSDLHLKSKPTGRNVTAYPRESGLLSETEVHITEGLSVSELLAVVAKGQYTAVQVTTAFIKRAMIAQQLVSG